MPDPAESPPRFTAAEDLRVFHFDDEAVVFDPLSWDAHLLNPAAVAVLEFLLQSPRSEHEVAAFLEEALHPDERRHAESHASRLLGELQSLGLTRVVEAQHGAGR